jgi:hypothetical protein
LSVASLLLCIVYLPTPPADPPQQIHWDWLYAPNHYNLWINCHTWIGQEATFAVYTDHSSGPTGNFLADGDWYYPDNMQYQGMISLGIEDSLWYDFGQVPYGTTHVTLVFMSPYGSGIVWIDAITLIPVGEQPTT